MTSTTATRPTVTWRTKLIYGAGAVAYGVKDAGFSYFLLFFYSQVVGLPAGWVSAGLLIASIADAVFDVMIGQISDHWRSRLGRRHPFMYAAALPASLAFVMLWLPPALPQVWLLVWLTVLTIAVRTFISLYEIPSSALVAELTTDYDQRTSFFAYRFFFAYWGGLALNLLTLVFLMRPTARFPVGQLNPAGYANYGIVSGAVMLVSILAATIGTHRQIPYLRAPPPRRPMRARHVAAEIIHTISNRSFIVILLSGITGNIAGGLSAGLSIFINTYFWNLSSNALAALLPGAFVGSAVGISLAPVLARRFGKKHAAVALALVSVGVSFAPFALRFAGRFPPNGSAALVSTLIGVTTLAVALGAAAQVMIASMLTDIVEENEIATGRRAEGLVLSANTFIIKSLTGIGVLASGVIVQASGLQAHAHGAAADPSAIRTLILIYVPVQIALYVSSILFLSMYRISRQSHQATLQRLAERAEHPPAPDGPAVWVEASAPRAATAHPRKRVRGLQLLLVLAAATLVARPARAVEIHIAPNWSAVDRTSVSTVTVQDCPEPPMRRGHPLHEAVYRALADLDVDDARLQPWQPYPHLSVAELRPPSGGMTYWDFSGMDEVTADFMAATHGRPVVFSLSAIPAWMLDPDAAAPVADADAIDWAYDQGAVKISDRTVELYAQYQARLASWYLKGGFRDEAGAWHASGHHYKVAYWEPLSEPAYPAKDVVRLYDAAVRAVRKVAPELKFAGPAFEDVLADPDAVAYFLDPRHHAAGTPIDLVTYHWYSQPPSDEPLAAAPYGLFARADALITAAGYIQTMTANRLPGARTAVNELGSTLPAPTAPQLWQPIPRSYWAMSGAMWAYIYGHLAHTGVSMLGAAEIFDYPGQFASASLLDWDTGQPNARYWVVKLLRDNFGPGDQVVRAEPETDFLKPTPGVQVYAQAFVTPAGVRRVLLVNKRDAPADVKVLGAAGGDVEIVDGSTKAAPSRQSLATSHVTLAPFAVAVVSLSAHPAPEPLSSDSPLRAILADPKARQVLAEMFPGIVGSKNLDQALDQSLRTLQVVAPSYITDEKLEAFDRRLAGGAQ